MNRKEFNEFEDRLFEIKVNPDIKYSIDKEMEAKVKYDYLIDIYGKPRVDEVVSDYTSLFDPQEFERAKKMLS
jgi:hypothetical protein